jgi:hypothetical protein
MPGLAKMPIAPIDESISMKNSKSVRSTSATGQTAMKSSGLAAQSKKLLALLVSRTASAEPTITYAEVAKTIGIHVCNLRHPMDHLSRTLEAYAASQGIRIPPLQLLVVNSKSGLPGPGAAAYIRSPYVKKGERYDTAKPARQREISNAVYAAISTFPRWEQVELDVSDLLE